jgi:hypothetical protein
MTAKSWHSALDPKVGGAWNLHHALQQLPKTDRGEIDFFLMTSSISGALGAATKCNY